MLKSSFAEIATITYRSGPEWEQRFGRRMLSEGEKDGAGDPGIPKLRPDFLIETYLDHQVELSVLLTGCQSLSHTNGTVNLLGGEVLFDI